MEYWHLQNYYLSLASEHWGWWQICFFFFFFLLWISEFLHFIRSLPSLRCHLQITVWPTFGLRLLFCCGDTAWCTLSLSLWSVRIEKTLQHCLQSNQRSGCSLFSYNMCCPVAWTVCGRKKLFDLEQCMQKPVKYKQSKRFRFCFDIAWQLLIKTALRKEEYMVPRLQKSTIPTLKTLHIW